MGPEAQERVEQYLHAHYSENVFLLGDLERMRVARDFDGDDLSLFGYRDEARVIGAQAFYRYGRWFPHFIDAAALDVMLRDMMQHRVRWIMGVRRVVDPIIEQLQAQGFHLDHDEDDYLYGLERAAFRPQIVPGVRRAMDSDATAIVHLRLYFENEYFGVPLERIDQSWCLRIAQRYIEQGTYIAEHDGRAVSMAAIEASIPEVSQIGAVYTERSYRGQGLAKGVVSALCQEQLGQKPQVSLIVRTDNDPALRAYRAVGFTHWHDYRMAHIA